MLSVSCPTLYRDCMKKERSTTWFSCSATGTTVLSRYHTCRTTYPLKPSNFWLPGAANLGEQLDQEVARYRGAAISDNTKKTYQTHLRSYTAFCEQSGVCARLGRNSCQVCGVPSPKTSSVKLYLNSICLLHLECNLDNPCADPWYLKTTITGTEKESQ